MSGKNLSRAGQGGAFGTTQNFAPEHPGHAKGKSQSPNSLEGDTGMNCSHKKRQNWGWKGSSKMQVHPTVPRSCFLFTPRLCHLRLRHHIPFLALSKGANSSFFGSGENQAGSGGERRLLEIPQALPTPDIPPWLWKKAGKYPGKGWKSPKSKRWRSGSCSIAQPWQFGAVSVPGTPVPQFPPRS